MQLRASSLPPRPWPRWRSSSMRRTIRRSRSIERSDLCSSPRPRTASFSWRPPPQRRWAPPPNTGDRGGRCKVGHIRGERRHDSTWYPDLDLYPPRPADKMVHAADEADLTIAAYLKVDDA